MESQKPVEQHRQLAMLEGSWEGEEFLSPSPWGPGGPAKGVYKNTLILDGFYLMQEYEEVKDGKVIYKGHGLMGFDPASGDFLWYWFDNQGMFSPVARGHWQDPKTLVFESPSPVTGGLVRSFFVFVGKDDLEFNMMSSVDQGVTWKPSLQSRYRRVGVPAHV
jgi:hypothetical protein